jgi:uncharacterized protein (TIGR02145 family)
MKKFYAILCLTIASLTQLPAQAPQGFNYQATVRNSSGDLIVNTNVYFKFNIMQGSQTSLPVFTEIHYVPTDDLGQVNLVIGQGTATSGAFSELDWSLGSYYLGIELDTGSGYVAMGTTQLLSVPYALYAENSGNSTPTTPNLEAVLAENNSANNQQIKDLQDPTEAQDAVTKNYTYSKAEVDALLANLQSQIDDLDTDNSSGSITDQDGNTYDYLTYGDQVWTVENAQMVTYSDGTPIPQVSSGESIDIQALNNDLGGTLSEWGLVGDATVNGWNGPDMEMYETSTNVFELYASLLGNQLKFRFNEDWGQNYGDTGADGTLEAGGNDIAVPGDGIYHVVLNLNSLTYSLTEVLSWPNLTTGAWCYYDNDPTKPRLYNWYAVMGIHDTDPNTPNKEFAPEGWHVPTDAEWTTLENYLIANGYNYDQTTTGNKIAKAMASTTGWDSSTTSGAPGNDQSINNISGFNAFPEGFRSLEGPFSNEGNTVAFWSSTDDFNSTSAYSYFIMFHNSALLNANLDFRNGYSVRFVRD